MMKFAQKLFASMAFLLCAHSAFANDSTGWVSTGGVQYFKNTDIRMVSEDLYISEDKIRVGYEFHNDTDHDVTETVLFPLPASNIQDYDSDFADIEALHQSFKIWVNGKTIQPSKHLRALWNETSQKSVDITHALINDCGLNEAQILEPYRSMEEVEQDKQTTQMCIQKLVSQGLIQKPTEDNEMWDTQMVYSWQQTFPAYASTFVKHEYQPLVGGSVAGIMRGDAYGIGDEMQKTYCFDKTFWQKMSATKGVHYPAYTALGYILTTGANWAKPIEKFHLTIDKPKGTLMSLCWDASLKKISDTRFEAVKAHFTPKRDIEIIFAMPAQYEE